MSISDFLTKLWNTIKVNASELSKIDKYVSGLSEELLSTSIIEAPSYDIEKMYLDALESYKNKNANKRLVFVIMEYKNKVSQIPSHNETIMNLNNRIRTPMREIEVMLKDVLEYDDSFFVKNDSLIREIKQYSKITDVAKQFIDLIDGYKKNREKLLDELEKEINEKRNMIKSTSRIEEFSDKSLITVKKIEKNGYLIYKRNIDDFNYVCEIIKNHNRDIDNLINQLDKIGFDYQEYLNDPISRQNRIPMLKDFISKVEKYENKTEILGKNYILIKKFVSNYNQIIIQYKSFQKYKKLKDFADIYYDKRLAMDVLKSYDEIISEFHQGELFYDFYSKDKVEQLIENHNNSYIKNHLKDTLFDNVNGKVLDDEQKSAILCDSLSNLVIAGAGSGKTLTICGKVKFLLNNGIREDEILLLSFSKDSVKDLDNKIKMISSNIEVKTFHALGLRILKESIKEAQDANVQFEAIIRKYFTVELRNRDEMQRKILEYYALYLSNSEVQKKYSKMGDLFIDLKEAEYITLKNQMNLSKNNSLLETINREYVRSYEELAIANFYFLNGINYTYETSYKEEKTSSYQHRQYLPDFYLNDYGIYHEHYGIDNNGRACQYEEDMEREYLAGIAWKRSIHTQNHSRCLETYSYEFSDGSVFEKIKNYLKSNNVQFKPLNKKQISDAINSIYYGRQFDSFIKLIITFISLYKSRFENDGEFELLKTKSFKNKYEMKRASLFLDICKDIYNYYKKFLDYEHKIDFDDMILKSTRKLKESSEFKYKYIIVDEFQDMSYSRMRFLKELIVHGNSKLFAVGDDWQAIYRFCGCDLNIFLKFEDYFEDATYNYITFTYRNSQQLQNIASSFIMKNPEQHKKNIKSNKSLHNPIRIMYFENDRINALNEILNEIGNKKRDASVLLLGRNKADIDPYWDNQNFFKDKNGEIKSNIFSNLKIRFKTVHSSKGLEDEFVIILNAEDSKLGFPNKIEDDPLLNLVLASKSNFLFAEERRLWYVALTRTKSYTYILVNKKYPSQFVKEIEKECVVTNAFNEVKNDFVKLCPICKSGNLVIKANSRNHNQFYGCTNYPYCMHTESLQYNKQNR